MSPRTIAIANAAGSAGKSTTTVTLAALLAREGQRVLVIDGDAQATATFWLGVDTPAYTVGDVLHRRCKLADAITTTNTAGVSLLPATAAVDSDVIQLTSTRGGEQRMRLALAEAKNYDLALVDCPGSINAVTLSALVAADSVITVTAPTLKEMGGIPQIEEIIADLAEAYNSSLALRAIIPCSVPRNAGKGYDDMMALLTESYAQLVTPSIRRTVRVMESHGNRSPLPAHAPNDGVTHDYEQALAWLNERGVL